MKSSSYAVCWSGGRRSSKTFASRAGAAGRVGVQPDSSRNDAKVVPELNEARGIANLLGHHARLRIMTGDDRSAIAAVQDILRLADDTQRVYGALVTYLIGHGIRALAVSAIEQLAPDLAVGRGERAASADDVRRVIDRLLDDAADRASWKQACAGRAIIVQFVKSFRSKPIIGTLQTNGLARSLKWHVQVEPAAFQDNYPAAIASFRNVPPPPRTVLASYSSLASILHAGLERVIETSFRVKCESRLAATALAMVAVSRGPSRATSTLARRARAGLPFFASR